MFCQNCGTSLENNARFCPKCGAAVNAQAGGNEYHSGETAPNPGGYAQNPGGYAQNPGGYAQNPGGYAQNPGGYAQNPGGYAQNPGGYAQNPGGYAQNPGGYAQNPGGYAPNTGGYAPSSGGYAQNSAGAASGIGAASARQLQKQVFTKPLALVAVICFTVALALNVIFLLLSLSQGEEMANMLSALGFDGVDFDIGDVAALNTVSVVLQLVSMVPMLLVVIALWKIYISAKDPGSPAISESGLTLLRGTVIAQMVISIVTGIFTFLAMIGMINSYSALGDALGDAFDDAASAATGVLVMTMIFAVGAMVLMIVFYKKLSSAVGIIRYTAVTGDPSDELSGFAGVMLFIVGGTSGLGALFMISSLQTFFMGIATALAYIFLGVIYFNYRTQIRTAASYMTGKTSYEQWQGEESTDVVCSACGARYDRSKDRCPFCGEER